MWFAQPTRFDVASVRYDPGGGGVNVAQVAHNLGASVTAVFPSGGATGDVFGDLLTAKGVPFRRVKIAGSTRESFTINEISTGLQYRFVLPGPSLTFAELQQCLVELRHLATSATFVVASGSLPPGVPSQFLPAGGSGLPGSRRAVGSGHLGRRPQTPHLRCVPAEGERARIAGMRWARTRHGIRADGRRARNR